MHIGMTYDLREDYLRAGYSELETAEFDRPDTVEAIEAALQSLGHTVDRIGNVRDLAGRLVLGQRWDLVFNICEGLNGLAREAQVPALLDAWNIPYTFSDGLVCALTLHKGMTKRVVMSHGIPSPAFAEVARPEDVRGINLPLPLFAKPVAEGTGKGVNGTSRVVSRGQLRKVCLDLLKQFQQPVLVETFLPGREFTTGILGTGDHARVVATMEVILGARADQGVYSYNNKENSEELVHYQLLKDPVLSTAVEKVALDAWRALGCRDAGRVDIRLDAEGQPHFMEVNPLAGLHYEHSDLPIMATMAGMDFNTLIGAIVESAAERVAARPAAVRVA